MSSFKLTRGYEPSISGILSTRVTPELLTAYKQQVSVRVLQTFLKSKLLKIIPPSLLHKGEEILFYYRSSKRTEVDEWRSDRIYELHIHYVTIDVGKLEAYPKILCQDLRLRPSNNLCSKITEGYIDEEMNSTDNAHVGEIVT